MKQRTIALLLALMLVSGIAVSAFAAEATGGVLGTAAADQSEEAKTEEDSGTAEGTQPVDETAAAAETADAENAELRVDEVTGEELQEATEDMLLFHEIEELVKKNNPTYKSLQASAGAMDDMESMAGTLYSQIAALEAKKASVGLTQAEETTLDRLKSQYSGISGSVQDTTQMTAGCKQLIKGAEDLFIVLVGLEQQEKAVQRQLAYVERELEEMELRAQMGQISKLQLMQMQSGRDTAASGLATLQMNLYSYKLQLEQMVGKEMTGTVPLGTIPAVTEEELNALNFESDLKMAKRRSLDVQAASAQVDKAYDMSGMGDAGSGMIDAADYAYKAAQQEAERKFRALYAKLQDCRQVVTVAEKALECEKLAYQAAELKYQQGAISKNDLMDAEDSLKTAQDTLRTAKSDLFSAYNNYRWAVDDGVMS